MARIGLILVAAAFAAAVAGCGSVGSVGDAEWTLVATTPDGQTLLFETGFGGVASGCARFEGWVVEAEGDIVDVRARLWEAIGPQGCTDELVIERHAVQLDEPLGDRVLRGCGREDCVDPGLAQSGALQLLAPAAITDVSVVAPTLLGLEAFSRDGVSTWSAPMGRYRLVGNHDVVVGERDGALVALDAATGAVEWELDAHRLGRFVDGRLLLCSGGDSQTMSAVEVDQGHVVWSVDAGCEPFAVIDERVIIPTWDEAVDGGMRLRVVDSTTGKMVVDRILDDGVDDRVLGIDGAVGVGDTVMLSGGQSDLVVVDGDGVELLRRAGAPGWPLGVVGNLGVFSDGRGVTAVNESGLLRWSLPDRDPGSVAIAGEHLYTLDAGEIRRFSADVDPSDPAAVDWSADVGRTDAWSVATDGEVVVVMTMLSVVALDAETGALEWWAPIAATE